MDLGSFLPFLLGIGFLVLMLGMHRPGRGMLWGAHAGHGGVSRDDVTPEAGDQTTGHQGHPSPGQEPDAAATDGRRHGCC